jgi:hypothetical protein
VLKAPTEPEASMIARKQVRDEKETCVCLLNTGLPAQKVYTRFPLTNSRSSPLRLDRSPHNAPR